MNQPATNLRPPFVFERCELSNLVTHAETYGEIYRKHGALVFPGVLSGDPDFEAYRDEIAELANILLAEHEGPAHKPLPLQEAITRLAQVHRPDVGKLFDVGTRPAKLLSAMRLKMHPAFIALTRMAFGADAVIATPYHSDTLHMFPPGEENWRYNLPPHQDYPYLLQSPKQITFWINFGDYIPEIGGVAFWPGSHELGVLRQRRNQHQQFEAITDDKMLAPFPRYECHPGRGDLVVMNSLTVHDSIVNRTTDGTRVCQLFRYSDLRDPDSLRIRWSSAGFRGVGVTFEVAHPDLVDE